MRSGATRPTLTDSPSPHPLTQRLRFQPSLRSEWYLKIGIVAGLLAGLILTPRLWFGERLYPLTPVFTFLGPLPQPFDALLYGLLVASLVLVAIIPRPAKLILFIVLVASILVIMDQSRLQPWFYQCLIMLGAVAFYSGRGDLDENHHPGLNTCRLVVICVYFWSGLQKVHMEFMATGFPLLLAPYTHWLPSSLAGILNVTGFAVPFVEMALGVGLLFKWSRNYAVIGAVIMHVFILAAVGPWGLNYNAVIWPWNVEMPVFLFLLFWHKPNLSVKDVFWPKRWVYQKFVLVLVGVLPILSFFGLWDGFLSFALYAGNRNEATIYVNDDVASRLPRVVQEHLYRKSKADSPNVIFINEWSLSELGVVDYPEARIYTAVARYICSFETEPDEIKVFLMRKRVLLSPDVTKSYTCPDLLAPMTSGSTNGLISAHTQAPDFQLLSTSGTVHLAELRGKSNVVVVFVKSAFVTEATSQVKSYASLNARFAAANTRVLVISTSSLAAVKHWASEEIGDASISILSDQMRSTTQAYGLLVVDGAEAGMARPSTVVVDKQGQVVSVSDGVANSSQILEVCKHLK